MAKRFDKIAYPLLSLLTRGKCLDDVLIFKPEMNDKARMFFEMAERVENEKRKPTELELLLGKAFRQEAEDYKNKLDTYVNASDKVHMDTDSELDYDVLCRDYADFEPLIDKLFGQPQPRAYYIPNSTAQTIHSTADALKKKMRELFPDAPTESGMLLFDETAGLEKGEFTIAYHLCPTSFSGCCIFTLDKDKSPYIYTKDFFYIDLTSPDSLDMVTGSESSIRLAAWIWYALLCVLFLHFFQTEKVVSVQPAANARSYSRASLNGQHYDSNLTYPINVIDAHWYTTIVRSDPFLVKGHWRKQPYGNGRSQYKVIYIHPFQKNGMTRKRKHEAATELPLNLTDDATKDHPATDQPVDTRTAA